MKIVTILLLGCMVESISSQALARNAQTEHRSPLLPPTPINIDVNERFTLTAQYYSVSRPTGATIILHDCSGVLEPFNELAQLLQQRQHNALVVSLRGYGESATELHSHKKIKEESNDIVSYQQKLALLTTFWQDDVLEAYQFLRNSLDKKLPINMITSGCSALYAVSTAEKMRINKAVFITPELDYSGKERYKNLMDIPTYFIESIYHVDSYQVTNELFSWNGSGQTKLQLFKGDHYNTALLRKEPSLIQDIALWLTNN